MPRSVVVASAAAMVMAGCAAFGSGSSSETTLDGYLSSGSGLRLYRTRDLRDQGERRDCTQILRSEPGQRDPIPGGRVRVRGRPGVLDDLFQLARLQIGSDHATHELCDGRYVLAEEIVSISEVR